MRFSLKVIAVAIETAIQNGGIAVVVLNLTFPRYHPTFLEISLAQFDTI